MYAYACTPCTLTLARLPTIAPSVRQAGADASDGDLSDEGGWSQEVPHEFIEMLFAQEPPAAPSHLCSPPLMAGDAVAADAVASAPQSSAAPSIPPHIALPEPLEWSGASPAAASTSAPPATPSHAVLNHMCYASPTTPQLPQLPEMPEMPEMPTMPTMPSPMAAAASSMTGWAPPSVVRMTLRHRTKFVTIEHIQPPPCCHAAR